MSKKEIKKRVLVIHKPANNFTTPVKSSITTDTLVTRTVVITSSFKPSLQNAAKINFTAASIISDSTKLSLTYKIPSSNLFFSYQPVSVSPLAMPIDSAILWKNNHQFKLGLGNLSSVLAEGRFSFGDGKKSITTLQGNFLNTAGSRFGQQKLVFGLEASTILNTEKKLEWTSRAYFNTNTLFRYGYQPESLVYSKDQLLLVYNSVGLEAAVKNKIITATGINFNPSISYSRFTNNINIGENNLVMKLPIEKVFSKIFSFRLALAADMADFKTAITRINNNLFVLNPAIVFNTPHVKLNLGLRPGWDNKNYSMLPDIKITSAIPNLNLFIEAGWEGEFVKNGFRSIAAVNPWIGTLNKLNNTSITEQFLGIKGGVPNHFSFNAKIAYQQIKNQPLFLNEPGDGKNFVTLFEPNMKAVKLMGELNYTVQENFSLLGSVAYTQFNKLSIEPQAWGLLPFETTVAFQWKPLNDLHIKADLFYRDGIMYRDIALAAKKLSPAIDMNLGLEFSLQPKLNVWLQMNNLLNNTYQRWNQYPVFGFNVMGGVVYSFQ